MSVFSVLSPPLMSALLYHFSALNTSHCTSYTVHRTVYSLHGTLFTVNCTMYTVPCSLFTVYFTLFFLHGRASVQTEPHLTWASAGIPASRLYTIHCTLYTVHCTLYTLYCTIYTVHCRMYTIDCTLYIPAQEAGIILSPAVGHRADCPAWIQLWE